MTPNKTMKPRNCGHARLRLWHPKLATRNPTLSTPGTAALTGWGPKWWSMSREDVEFLGCVQLPKGGPDRLWLFGQVNSCVILCNFYPCFGLLWLVMLRDSLLFGLSAQVHSHLSSSLYLWCRLLSPMTPKSLVTFATALAIAATLQSLQGCGSDSSPATCDGEGLRSCNIARNYSYVVGDCNFAKETFACITSSNCCSELENSSAIPYHLERALNDDPTCDATDPCA